MTDTTIVGEFPPHIPPHNAEDITTAIDHDRARQLVMELEQHGATVGQLDTFLHTAKLPDGKTVEKLSSVYFI